ncbi:2-keto-4-pentenoate hydratase [Taklimakanibacter lacteus]|uniref:2-keto-4-pentenoate hydratase n=1 Tax=Taklimakanibacter lacteus TaxID=2268456 RepID=UPI0034D52785
MSESAAEILARQRLSLSPIDLATNQRPANEDAAYDLQGKVNALLAQDLGRIRGHKIGCTTPVMQEFLGIGSPCAGRVFAGTVLDQEGEVARSRYRRLGVECEIAVEIGTDIEPRRKDYTPEGLLAHVNAVMAGIEVVDDRYADYRALGVGTLIADNFFNAGCVLGVPIIRWRSFDLAGLVGHMRINGRDVGRGTGALVMGHPFNALAWLANRRSARGEGLRRGEFVFLGSLVETKWLAAGDEVAIEIERLGTASLLVGV